MLKPEIGADAVGATELKADAIRSGHVKDFSLRCKDFRPAAEACGVPGPRGPAGPAGADGGTGGEGLTKTTVRMHEEVIEMTCSEPADGPMGYSSHCSGEEEVKASCEPGEVATGGSVGSPSRESQSFGTGYYDVGAAAGDDRPDPLSGTPTAWIADANANGWSTSYTSDPPATPTDPSVKVYAVCAS